MNTADSINQVIAKVAAIDRCMMRIAEVRADRSARSILDAEEIIRSSLLCCILGAAGCGGNVANSDSQNAGGSPNMGGAPAVVGLGGSIGCYLANCNPGSGGLLGIGGAAFPGGAMAAGGAVSAGGAGPTGGSPPTGGVPSIVPACPGIDIPTTPPDAGSNIDSGQPCTVIGAESDPSPVDLFIMVDRSASMTNPLQNSSIDRWDAIEQGFQKFFSTGSIQGSRIGLGFFGKTNDSADPAECDPSNHAQPAVSMDFLSNNATAVLQAVTNERNLLGGLTPIVPALQGALQFAQKSQIGNPDIVAVVLVTDGYATECDLDMTHAVALANDALQMQGLFAGGPSIRTYVIGIAVDPLNLDPIAQAGGTVKSTLVDGPTAPDQFAAALSNVRNSINSVGWSCTFSIPAPPGGQIIDPNIIQAIYKPFAGNNQEIPRADPAAHCGGTYGGWYFDSLANPSTITLCPCSCANFAAGSIEFRFGCFPNGIQ